MRICTFVVTVSVFLAPLPAAAQQRAETPDKPRLIISERAIAGAIAVEQRSNNQRDSVANGAIIGAVVGAAIMGGFVTYLCHALKEPGDPSCWKGSGLAFGIGAGAGALGGAGIDALIDRQPRDGVPGRNGVVKP